jgi:hypothetical protein
MVLAKRNVSRRGFLKGAAVVAGGAVALPAFQALGLLQTNGRVQAAPGAGAYGPISPKADLRDGVERISLPDGFVYRSFGVGGDLMSDGNPTPLAHDGMAAFALPNGNIRLIRNHEDRNGPGLGSVMGDPAKKYDALGGGGCVSLEVDPTTRELVADFVSINGTIVNCAGGLTPWGSWLTCEETVAGPAGGWGKPHGYVFDVPVLAGGPVDAMPLTVMGRFAHEAVAVDPASGIVYETEDSGSTSGFYRFIPDVPGQLGSGKLQMLSIKGKPNYDTQTGQKAGKPLPVEWVDIDDPDPPVVTGETLFNEGYGKGAANFNRLEGCWYHEGHIYFNSTEGGDAELGQVWEYRPLGSSGGQLTLIFESPGIEVLNLPDNLCVSPRGGLLLCEDGDDINDFLRGLTLRGEIFDFAQNIQTGREWAGACFSPDGQTLFVNRQGKTSFPVDAGDEGMTFAIWGPWEDGVL